MNKLFLITVLSIFVSSCGLVGSHNFGSGTIDPSGQDGAKKITAFEFDGKVVVGSSNNLPLFANVKIDGVINENTHTITAVVPKSVIIQLTEISPTVTFVGNSISPTSATKIDFSSPVTYTVTANNGSTQDYVVNIVLAINSVTDISSFKVPAKIFYDVVHGLVYDTNVTATINNSSCIITLDLRVDSEHSAMPMPLGYIVPEIVLSGAGATISPASGEQVSIEAAMTGTPVKYTVTAKDGTQQDYYLTIVHH